MDQTEYNLFHLIKEELYTIAGDPMMTNAQLNSIARLLTDSILSRYILTKKEDAEVHE